MGGGVGGKRGKGKVAANLESFGVCKCTWERKEEKEGK